VQRLSGFVIAAKHKGAKFNFHLIFACFNLSREKQYRCAISEILGL